MFKIESQDLIVKFAIFQVRVLVLLKSFIIQVCTKVYTQRTTPIIIQTPVALAQLGLRASKRKPRGNLSHPRWFPFLVI